MNSVNSVNSVQRGLRLRTVLWLLVFFLASLWLISPWGNFPLNDDWQYAWITKRFVESGGLFRNDPEVAPSLLGQTILLAPFIKIFGFSHLLLRRFTIALSFGVLLIFLELLAIGGASEGVLFFTGLLCLSNPLWLYLATTFMTEFYGTAFSLLGALIWFKARARYPDRLSMKPALGSALLTGFAYWIRQFSVLSYPALIGSYIFSQRQEFRRNRNVLFSACAVFFGTIALFSLWSRWTGNFRHAFAGPLAHIFIFHPGTLFLEAAIFVVYMTAFSYPFLMLFLFNLKLEARAVVKKLCKALLCCAVVAGLCYSLLLRHTHNDRGPMSPLHLNFPFNGNVIYNSGLGPVTLSDVYVRNAPLSPRNSTFLWNALGVLFILMSALWVFPADTFRRSEGLSNDSSLRKELINFFLMSAGLTLLVTFQAFQDRIFDRYYFPVWIFVIGTLALLLPKNALMKSRERWLCGIALWPLVFFSIGGVHDEFRWNEARWALYRGAIDSGISADRIEAGYESNGWSFYWDGVDPKKRLDFCDGKTLYCRSFDFSIVMNTPPGTDVVRAVQPRYWLSSGAALHLVKANHGLPQK